MQAMAGLGGAGGMPGYFNFNLFNTFAYRMKKEKKPTIVKLIKNDANNKLYKFINHGYALFTIVLSFGKKLLWFVSCSNIQYL